MPFSTLSALEPTTLLSRFVSGIIASVKPFLALTHNWTPSPLCPTQHFQGVVALLLVICLSPPPFLLNRVILTQCRSEGRRLMYAYWWTEYIHLDQFPLRGLNILCKLALTNSCIHILKNNWVSTKYQALHCVSNRSGFTMKFEHQGPSLAPLQSSEPFFLWLCIFIS